MGFQKTLEERLEDARKCYAAVAARHGLAVRRTGLSLSELEVLEELTSLRWMIEHLEGLIKQSKALELRRELWGRSEYARRLGRATIPVKRSELEALRAQSETVFDGNRAYFRGMLVEWLEE